MDEILMRWAEAHHCADCATETLFVPVPDAEGRLGARAEWCCTACDAAVELGALVPLAA